VITREEIDFAVAVMEEAVVETLSGRRSAEADLPVNPYTRKLVETRPWQRRLDAWWRSSPEQWLEKGRTVVRKQFGVAQK
jgi:hypothetical protein